MNFDPNHFGWSDIARRREFERLHNGAPIQPMDNPARDNALGLTLWLFAAGMTLALITIGLLGMAGRG